MTNKLRWLYSLVTVFLLSAGFGVYGQTTIFSENMGTVSGTTAISTHVTNEGFQNNGTLLFTGGDVDGLPADIRITDPSSNYANASGEGNIFFSTGSSNIARGFAIENIDASAFTNLQLQFGYRKEQAAILPNLLVDYWNGTEYVNLPFTFNEALDATVGWYLSPMINLPEAAQIDGLKLRWVRPLGGDRTRIDDVVLIGTEDSGSTGVDITFQVDMGEIPVNGVVSLGAAFTDPQFSPNNFPLTQVGESSVWEITVNGLTPNAVTAFKFVNGNNWGNNEGLNGQPCSDNDGNRVITIPAESGTVCFNYNTCVECGTPPAPSYDVTFQVALPNGSTVSEDGLFVAVFADGFTPTLMTEADGVYSATLSLQEGINYIYKFRNGANDATDFEAVPAQCGVDDNFGGNNRTLVGPAEATTLDVVCFGSCEACPDPNALTEFNLVSPADEETVQIAGDAQNTVVVSWTASTEGATYEWLSDEVGGDFSLAVPFTSDNEGSATTLTLTMGQLDALLDGVDVPVGGSLTLDWTVRATLGDNSLLAANGPRTITLERGVVTTPNMVDVTFQVAFPEGVMASEAGVFVQLFGYTAEPVAMMMNENNIYTATISVVEGDEYIYKFINGVEGFENNTDDCFVNDGMGNFNRTLVGPAEATILDVVCFNSCEACPEPEPLADFNLLTPIDQAVVTVEGEPEAEVNITWEASTMGSTYTWVAILPNGNFEEPLLSIPSNNEGTATTLTLTVEALDAVLDTYEVTESIDLLWNVVAENGNQSLTALNGPRAITLERGVVNYPTLVEVSFTVAILTTELNVGGLSIAGTFNNFTPQMMDVVDFDVNSEDPANYTFYSITLMLEENATYQYKFVNGAEFETLNGDCTADDGNGNLNRTLVVGEVAIFNELVGFGSCDSPDFTPDNVCNDPIEASASEITETSALTSWTAGGDEGTFEILYGVEGFLADEENDGTAIENIEGTSQLIEGLMASTAYDVYVRAVCADIESVSEWVLVQFTTADEPLEPVSITFQVDMGEALINGGVSLGAAFTDPAFQPSSFPLTQVGETSIWEITIDNLEAGLASRFKFVNGTNWPNGENGFTDENFNGQPCNDNGDRAFTIPTESGTVCFIFNSCVECGTEINNYDVTFQVSFPEDVEVSADGVFVAVFGAETIQLTENEGIYSGTVSLQEDLTYSYKFRNGLGDADFESVNEACGVPDGFGGFNRTLTVGSEDTTLPVVCFASCEACVIDEPSVCGTQFTDPGGIDANYPSNSDVTTTLCPDNAGETIRVNFESFNTESGWDGLLIYDSNVIDVAALISSGSTFDEATCPNGAFTGTGDFAPTVITASNESGCLTFRFLSDGSLNNPGWVADVTCSECHPIYDLEVNNVTSTSADVSWTASGDETTWEILYGPEGFLADEVEGTLLSVETEPILALTDLMEATAYDLYVRYACSEELDAEWVLVNFTTLAGTDLEVVALAAPLQTTCYTSEEAVSVTVGNSGGTVINFADNNLTITVNVTGAVTETLELVVTEGELAIDATQVFELSTTFDMSAFGTYTFDITATLVGDGNADNNSLSVEREYSSGAIEVNYNENFNTYTTTAQVITAGWLQGPSTWGLSPATWGFNESYAVRANVYGATTGTNAVKGLSTPTISLPEAALLTFKHRITNFSGGGVNAYSLQPEFETIEVYVVNACDPTIEELVYVINSENQPAGNGWFDNSVFIEGFDSQVSRIKFVGRKAEGATAGNDWYIGIDNVQILEPSAVEFNLLTPVDQAVVEVEGDPAAEIQITWEEATETSSYTWLAVLPEGNFAEPLLSIPSDNGGIDNTLTLTVGVVYDVLGQLGIEVGEGVTLEWTVLASDENGFASANNGPFTITLNRGILDFCFAVEDLAVSDVTDNAALITWTAPFGATEYAVTLLVDEEVIDTFEGIEATELLLENLDSQTAYTVSVVNVCAEDESSEAVTASFTTECSTFELDFVETFEEDSNSLGCFQLLGGTGWSLVTNASGFGESASSIRMNFYNTSAGSVRDVVSPVFEATPENYFISFDHAYATYATEVDVLEVWTVQGNSEPLLLISLAGGVDGPLATAAPQTGAFVPTAAQWNNVSFEVPTGTTRYILRAISAFGNNLFIDNVTVSPFICPVDAGDDSTTSVCDGDASFDLNSVISEGATTGGVFTDAEGVVIENGIIMPDPMEVGEYVYTYTVTDEVSECTDTATITINIDLCDNINVISGNIQFSLYPNPSNGLFNIESAYNGNVLVEVADLQGRTVYAKQHVFNGNANNQVDISGVAQGVYLIRLTSGKEVSVARLSVK